MVDQHFGERWRPLHKVVDEWPSDFFAPIPPTEYDQVLNLWQDAMEWSYYDQVLAGIKQRSCM
ncbi:MAG: DUF2309 domain-containing protein, partial [Bacteroidia bacterium]|nr:DUF2309 domain-containing protein [Bacteroidia bacterium]